LVITQQILDEAFSVLHNFPQADRADHLLHIAIPDESRSCGYKFVEPKAGQIVDLCFITEFPVHRADLSLSFDGKNTCATYYNVVTVLKRAGIDLTKVALNFISSFSSAYRLTCCFCVFVLGFVFGRKPQGIVAKQRAGHCQRAAAGGGLLRRYPGPVNRGLWPLRRCRAAS
jgi:hypothetical protein